MKLCHIRTFWCCQTMFQELGFSLLVTRCLLQPTPKSQLSMFSLQMLCFPKEYFRHWTLLEAWWRLCWQRLDPLVFSDHSSSSFYHIIQYGQYAFLFIQNFNECCMFFCRCFYVLHVFYFSRNAPDGPTSPRHLRTSDAQAEDEGLECQAAKEAAMLTVEQVMKERETVSPGGPVVAQWCPVVARG